MNFDIFGISEPKWTRIGKFNSDDYIIFAYYIIYIIIYYNYILYALLYIIIILYIIQ